MITKEKRDLILKDIELGNFDLYLASEELKDDEIIVKRCIKKSNEYYEFISERLKKDRGFTIELVRSNCFIFRYLDDDYKNDEVIVQIALKEYAPLIIYAGEKFKKDKKFILEVMKYTKITIASYLDDFNVLLKKDKDFMLSILKIDGKNLKYASEDLKDDKKVVLEAFKQDFRSLSYASQNIRQDKNFLYEIKDLLRKNKEIFSQEYQLLLVYEREDNLLIQLNVNSQRKDKRKKI